MNKVGKMLTNDVSASIDDEIMITFRGPMTIVTLINEKTGTASCGVSRCNSKEPKTYNARVGIDIAMTRAKREMRDFQYCRRMLARARREIKEIKNEQNHKRPVV
jgi:hypothetical protein